MTASIFPPMDESGVNFSSTKNHLDVYTQIVTPAIARRLLDSNIITNRKIDKKQVSTYARQMAKGLWRCDNGEGLGLTSEGVLLNGQHRLMAVIEYGQPVEMLIFSGIPESAMTSLDDGKRRSLSDAFFINGKSMPNQTAINGAINCLMILHGCTETNKHYLAVETVRRYSTSEKIEFFEKLPLAKEIFAAFFEKFKYTNIARTMPLGVCLSMWYLFREEEEILFSIFKSFETGIPFDDLKEGSPTYHVYNRSSRNREMKIRTKPNEHVQVFLWCLTKCLEKKKVSSIPSFSWSWDESNQIHERAIRKLKRIEF